MNLIYLKKNIIKLITNHSYKNQNPHFDFVDDICTCNITKESPPNWVKHVIYNNVSDLSNITQHRIIMIKYKCNTYYIEKNGSINLTSILNNSCFQNFEESTWKELSKNNEHKEFKELITLYIANGITKIEGYEQLKQYNVEIDININNIDEYEKLYKELPNIPHEHKLPPCEKSKSIQDKTKKFSETVYNKHKHVSTTNDKYLLIDLTNVNGCEVGDIYDTHFGIFFHNKKSSDLRVLGFQTIIGLLILKNPDKCRDYFTKLRSKNIDCDKINIDNIKYAVGIIKTSKSIHYKDQITLGIVHHFFKKNNVELYVDYIDVVQ